MKPKPLHVEDVIRFATANDGSQFRTLARNKTFVLRLTRTGITFDLRHRTNTYLPVNRENIGRYLAIYNKTPEEEWHKTSLYGDLREGSYMVRILAEIRNDQKYRSRKKEDEELEKAPKTTRRALYLARIGQGQFRDDLLEAQGACYVTGVTDPRFLRASHIRPWSTSSDTERLDKNNGLLLTPLYDHLFDRHLISFRDDGRMMLSKKIPAEIVESLGLDLKARGRDLGEKTKRYLKYHRAEFTKQEKS